MKTIQWEKSIIRTILFISIIFNLITAQFFFGRNKIQYEAFDWKILKTEHFDIYYDNVAQSLAGITAELAEDIHGEFSKFFNYAPEKRIPIIIYANHLQFQQTNTLPSHIPEGIGGFFEFIKGRMVLPYTGRMWDYIHVMRHELIHVFMNHKINHHTRKAKKWDTYPVPLWFSEGLAEWWAIGWDTKAEMVLRDAIYHDKLVPLRRTGGYLVYKEGQSFFRYFEGEFGKNKILKIMETYWEYDSFEDAVSEVTGVDYNQIMAEWENQLVEKFELIAKGDEAPLDKSSSISEGQIVASPKSYDAGKKVAFLSNRMGYTDIRRVDLDGGKIQTVVKGERSPDMESLHLLNSDFDINNDGMVVFSAKDRAHDELKIVSMNNGKLVNELNHSGLISIRSPKWSQPGDRIVFSATDRSGFLDIYLWDVDDDKLVKITEDHYADRDPAFHGENEIIFSSDRSNEGINPAMNLFKMNLDNGSIQALTQGPFSNTRPIVKDEKIYYLSNRSGIKNIWELDFKKMTAPAQITNYHLGVEGFDWERDSIVVLNQFSEYSFGIYKASFPDKIFDRPDTTYNKRTFSGYDYNRSNELIADVSEYEMNYSFDLAQTAVSYDPYFGILGGGQMSMSDILGNRYYHFLVSNSAQELGQFFKRFNFAVTTVDLSKRTNLALGIFYFSNDYYDPYQAFYYEQSYGARVGINIPVDVFRRFELGTSIWYSKRDYNAGEKSQSLLASNSISYVRDNALWSPLGPANGNRFRISLVPVFDFSRGIIYNYTALVDYRHYNKINTTFTFANRFAVLVNDGKDRRRHYIGGSWGMRGYEINELFGSRYIMVNSELRFFLAKPKYWDGKRTSLGIGPWEGAIYVDAGNAWEKEFPGWKGSVGFGLRVFFAGTVIRYDMGRKTDFKSLDKSWYKKLFFGWDF